MPPIAKKLRSPFLQHAAAIVIIIAGLKVAQEILLPVLFAVFIAVIALGAAEWLSRRGVARWLAIVLVALGIVATFSVLVVLIARSLDEITAAVPGYRERLRFLRSDLVVWLAGLGVPDTFVPGFKLLSPENGLDLVVKAFRKLVGAFSTILLVIILVLFILAESASFKRRFRSTLGQKINLKRVGEVAGDISRFLIIKTFTSALTGITVGLWVWAMGLDFALIWGLTAFFLNYIPVIGSIVASIPALLIALISLGLGDTAILAGGYIVINVGISNFMEPVIMGRGLGLSPLVVFLSLVFWGWLWGPAGMLLSVPLAMVLKIVAEHSSEFDWLAALMGEKWSQKTAQIPGNTKS